MANAFEGIDGISRGVTTYSGDPAAILIDPEVNGRHEYDEESIVELALDIEARGQDTPVKLRKNDDGRPVLVFGHRRWQAFMWLRKNRPKNEWKINGTYETLTRLEAFEAAVGENRFRKDTTPMDDAHNIHIFRKLFGLSPEDIAKRYFPSAKDEKALASAVRWVNDRASLVELASEVAEGVQKGDIKVTAAVRLAKLSKTAQRAKLAESGGRVKVADTKPVPSKKDERETPKGAAVGFTLECRNLADRLSELALDNDATVMDVAKASRAYRKARGLE